MASTTAAVVERVDEIPVIDFAPFLGGTAKGKAEVAAAIRSAAETIGFFYIAGHGIPEQVIATTFEVGRRFFALPAEAKNQIRIREQHGYQALKDVTRPGYLPNINESFFFGADLSPDDPDVLAGVPLHAANQWPSALPEMRPAFEAYRQHAFAFGRQLLGACALALEIPEDSFEPYYTKPVALIRMIHYPASSDPRPDNQFGNPPHTDYGCITFLAQDDVGGLAVRRRGGDWIDAVSLPGTFIVNIADMLQRWTNDRWVSTVHRVINDPGRSRYSLPTFFDPNYHAVVSCIESCQGPGNPARHAPITFGEYYKQGLDKTYGYRKAAKR
jgi:isopenicillin N synthase-like dioxygenase